jgi:hypothetical protein
MRRKKTEAKCRESQSLGEPNLHAVARPTQLSKDFLFPSGRSVPANCPVNLPFGFLGLRKPPNLSPLAYCRIRGGICGDEQIHETAHPHGLDGIVPLCKVVLISGNEKAAELLAEARGGGYEFEIPRRTAPPVELLNRLTSLTEIDNAN